MSADALPELVTYLARLLIPEPEIQAQIETRLIPEEGGSTTLELRVPERERGRVIGKQGRTAEAIRVLLQAAAARRGTRASLRIAEE